MELRGSSEHMAQDPQADAGYDLRSALELPWRSTGQPWNCRSLFSQILWQESLQFPSRAGNFEGLVREGEQYNVSLRGLTVGMRIGFEVGIRIGIGISMPADFGAKDGYV